MFYKQQISIFQKERDTEDYFRGKKKHLTQQHIKVKMTKLTMF